MTITVAISFLVYGKRNEDYLLNTFYLQWRLDHFFAPRCFESDACEELHYFLLHTHIHLITIIMSDVSNIGLHQALTILYEKLTPIPSEMPGNYPCRAPRCKTCPVLRDMDDFSSHTTGQFYKVKFRASCRSSNIVCLITCRRCSLLYVGETSQPLCVRVNGHRWDITHRRT